MIEPTNQASGVPRFELVQGPLSPAELDDLGRLHHGELQESFLNTLGPAFQALYFTHLQASAVGFLVAARNPDDGEICGHISATTDLPRLYASFLLRRGIPAAWSARSQLVRVQSLRMLSETLLYPTRQRVRQLPRPEILTFTIVGRLRGSGLAGALYAELCRQLLDGGATRARAVTSDDLPHLHWFFEKRGGTKVAEIAVHKGRTSFIHVLPLDWAPPEEGASPR